jgi:hypothetical protein
VGSVVGPLVGTLLMRHFAIDGVFYFMVATILVLALAAGLEALKSQPSVSAKSSFKILTPQAGPLAQDLPDAPTGSVD